MKPIIKSESLIKSFLFIASKSYPKVFLIHGNYDKLAKTIAKMVFLLFTC